ncbi:histidine triad nucleotide-binding protein [Thermanaerothrix sp. 4228-RoL]|jgi:histidine triad (HIT) family protein|uniref:Histidine triad nucleotide-binding protein n=1 Tax=Thermanaerothrix solaris TaxID=3058434 RepID=A0ABU3NNG1_9CHLR|nr:histidine triad nucleotide-binding protein [Thermanaerothrix sp. 4228-RoL]MDT8898381.1 histidine triad nucleotide-binding protein [Thermanaerothrix sp. 4228-RoL]
MTDAWMDGCPFCRIVRGETDTRILYQDDLVTAFPDIRPIAPYHFLIVPNVHLESVNEVEPAHEAALGRMFSVARRLAEDYHVTHSGYRLIVNTGPHAGQSVFHLHMHFIAGRHMPFRA